MIFPPKSSISIGNFHYKPSILGYRYPYFWKHPYPPAASCWKELIGTIHPQSLNIWKKGGWETYPVLFGNPGNFSANLGGGVGWNIFVFSSLSRGDDLIWRAYVSNGWFKHQLELVGLISTSQPGLVWSLEKRMGCFQLVLGMIGRWRLEDSGCTLNITKQNDWNNPDCKQPTPLKGHSCMMAIEKKWG